MHKAVRLMTHRRAKFLFNINKSSRFGGELNRIQNLLALDTVRDCGMTFDLVSSCNFNEGSFLRKLVF